MLQTIRKIVHLIGRNNRGRWAVLAGLAVVASIIEVVGAGLVYILLALIANPAGRIEAPVVGDLRGMFPGFDDTAFLVSMSVAIGAFFVLRAATQMGITYAKQRMAHNAGARLSAHLMQGYLHLPYSFHLRRNSSELVRNAHTQVRQVTISGFLQVIFVFAETIMVVGLLAVMVAVAPGATVLAVVIVGAAMLLLLKVVQPRLKRQGAIAQEMEKRTLASIQQSLHGVRDIKVLGSQHHFGRQYERSRQQQARALYLEGTARELPRHVVELALFGFIISLFAISLVADATTEEMLATLGLFAYVGLRLRPSIQRLVIGLNHLKFMGPAIDDIHTDIELIEQHASRDEHAEGVAFEDRIVLDNVSFAYDGAPWPALTGVDLEIRRGEAVGICGPTGGGKTTLVDLVTGLLEPTEGRVTVDGKDLRSRTRSWFRRLGVVPQMVFLVDDTLRHNIAFGVDDGDVDEDALREAVELAQLDEFVASLPEGLDTVVGERGVRVSGGQRQRIAIARALYRRPDVLIFDEGTSALDNTTESMLMASFQQLRGTRTIILVAHRLSTVRNCDRIVYVEAGRVAGIGRYEELQQQSPGFRAMAQNA